MNHRELIALLYRHSETLEEAYRASYVHSAPDELVSAGLLIPVGDRYLLNKAYVTFIDTVLDRADYAVVFGDYAEEHKELVRTKKRFEQTRKLYYRDKMVRLCEDIYLKFDARDRQIAARLKDLERNEADDIDIIIEEANDILDNITELVDASKKITRTFSQLKHLDTLLKARLDALDEGLFRFMENISASIDWLNRFIVQTKHKRRQNRLFMQLAHDIIHERSDRLEHTLSFMRERAYHTLPLAPRKKPHYLPAAEDMPQLRRTLKQLTLIRPPRKLADTALPRPKSEPMRLIDPEPLIAQLSQNGCDDLYLFLKETLNEYDDETLFKLYLILLSKPQTDITPSFNRYGIRRVTWQP